MANVHYELIDQTQLELNDYVYQLQSFQMSLKDFLLQHTGQDIYIYRPSIETSIIRAIVIPRQKTGSYEDLLKYRRGRSKY
jgi:hypothetical protein